MPMLADDHVIIGATKVECVHVSDEMTALLACGPAAAVSLPPEPVALIFTFACGAPATLEVDPSPIDKALEANIQASQLVLLVCREAMVRIGGRALMDSNQRSFHLPSELRAIALALRDAPGSPEARTPYRLAKSIELLCETVRLHGDRALVALSAEGILSLADSRRLVAARQMIDERWNEKLTLNAIARACGLNRAKLTRGFREMFDCTIAEALVARRLLEASRLLLTTDLPVSSVGYESGYLNNASFSRAFGRHFGRSPSHYRAYGIAA
jgi:AraC family transcriptional activator of pyochelin receptor